MLLKLEIRFEIDGLSPRALREAFVAACREAIGKAYADEKIDLGQAEELYRSIPQPGRA